MPQSQLLRVEFPSDSAETVSPWTEQPNEQSETLPSEIGLARGLAFGIPIGLILWALIGFVVWALI